MSWLSDNSSAIAAAASAITAVVAVVALVGVKFQVDAADHLQQSQSARDTYRAHLALAISNPDLARPEDVCGLLSSDRGGAYEAFVEHLLYSAEQMLAVGDGWQATFLTELSPHTDFLCSTSQPLGETDEISKLLTTFRDNSCPAELAC